MTHVSELPERRPGTKVSFTAVARKQGAPVQLNHYVLVIDLASRSSFHHSRIPTVIRHLKHAMRVSSQRGCPIIVLIRRAGARAAWNRLFRGLETVHNAEQLVQVCGGQQSETCTPASSFQDCLSDRRSARWLTALQAWPDETWTWLRRTWPISGYRLAWPLPSSWRTVR